MDYKIATLKNGLRVLTVPMPHLDSATVTVWIKVGSRYEAARVGGISHFLEHMVFKGSAKRPSARAISEAVDAIGGEFNAGTSKEWTNFYIKSRTETLGVAFDVLSDMVLAPLLKAEDIEREKGVIVEEIGMYEDTPMYRIGDIFEQLIFNGSVLGNDIIGTAKTVRGLTQKDFKNYTDTHYSADNLLVAVAGGVTQAQVLKLANKHFGDLKSKSDRPAFNKFSARQAKPRVLLHSKQKEQAHFILGFLGNKRGHKDKFVEAVLSSILGGGMSSRLFTEVREKRGLAYSVRTSVDRYMDTGYIGTYAGVATTKIDEAIKVVLSEHYALALGKDKITDQELAKAKEYIKGHLALSLEDTKSVNSFFSTQELLLGKIDTPDDVFAGIDKVTIKDVVRVAKSIFNPQNLNLAIIGPYKDPNRFKKLLR